MLTGAQRALMGPDTASTHSQHRAVCRQNLLQLSPHLLSVVAGCLQLASVQALQLGR